MAEIAQAVAAAVRLLLGLDPGLLDIVARSLRVSTAAVALAACVGLPLGAAVAIVPFPGRRPVAIALSALMGLPPVVAGLLIYLLLSRAGPLGVLGLLFREPAMVIAQWLLLTPIVAALTRQTIADLWGELAEPLRSLGASAARAVPTLLWEARASLVTVLLAAFGRAIAEVGAVIIVGGNIAGHTRVMTTAITLETSRGDLSLALALGLVLVSLSLVVNGTVVWLRDAIQGQAA